jgi:hypothetical protein
MATNGNAALIPVADLNATAIQSALDAMHTEHAIVTMWDWDIIQLADGRLLAVAIYVDA